MNTVLGDALKAAYEAKNEDIKSFIWKGPKQEIAGMKMQKEIKLVDATPDQLRSFYAHCISMLYSNDKTNPGRLVLKDLVNDQIEKCNTELFLRWMENKYMPNPNRSIYPRCLIIKDIRKLLDNNSDTLPKETWDDTAISAIMDNVPEEFRDVTIKNVLDGCLDKLGIFDKRHLYFNFITKLGVWFTPAELADLTVKDEATGKNRDRIEVIKERLRLGSNINIKINNKGLTFTEFRAMLTLKSKKYSDLTTDQLLALRNKVLFRFEDEIDYHISQWKNRMKQLELVANSKNFSINEPVA